MGKASIHGLAVCFCHKHCTQNGSLGYDFFKVLTCGGYNFKFTSVVVGKIQSFVDFWTEVSPYWLLAGDLL